MPSVSVSVRIKVELNSASDVKEPAFSDAVPSVSVAMKPKATLVSEPAFKDMVPSVSVSARANVETSLANDVNEP